MTYTTRVAPSPTGLFHLGTARTAYFNWLAARASGGKFILRIDDTDVERNDPAAVQVILDSMDWLGLDYDKIYYQSNLNKFHQDAAIALVNDGKARFLDNGAIALNIPSLPDHFHDTISGDIRITQNDHDNMEPLILSRGGDKLGQPTYQFASISDDLLMGVNWIIRGHDHISNTPKQIAIWLATGVASSPPQFSHVGLVYKDKKKLSKRDNAASLLWYRDQGYHPEAILSFLLRLGWGPTIDDKSTKVITRERALELFLDGGKMRASPAGYDVVKLNHIQANYERMLKIPNTEWISKRHETTKK